MSNVNLTISPTVAYVTVSPVQPALTISGVTSIPSGGAGGDLGGSYPNPTVDGLQGRALASTAPSNGQLLAWNDLLQRWEPTTMTGGTGTVTQVSSGTGLTGGPITTSGTLSVDFAASGSATAGKAVEATDSRLSNSRAPTGSAGGGLSGTYPNPSLVAPGSANQVFFHSNGGFGSSAFFVWNNAVSTLTLSNALGESVAFSPSGITANGQFTIGDTGGGNGTGVTLDDSAESVTFANYTFIDMGSATVEVAAVQLPSGEQIQNTVNGRVDILPKPNASNQVGVTFDMTSISNVIQLGSLRTSNGALNDGRLFWNIPHQTANSVTTIYGSFQWSGINHTGTAGAPQTLHLGVTRFNGGGGNADGNHVFALVNYGHIGNANRRPTTLYLDPQFFVYSADSAQANDYVRMCHDQTDGLIASGNGKMRVAAATRVRIEGSTGGFDLPTGDGSSGQVLTTNGSGDVSWATPTGGGVSEAFVIAMAVAL
jgi:hypothetical protein